MEQEQPSLQSLAQNADLWANELLIAILSHWLSEFCFGKFCHAAVGDQNKDQAACVACVVALGQCCFHSRALTSILVTQVIHHSQWSVKLERLVYYLAQRLLDWMSSAKGTKPNDDENLCGLSIWIPEAHSSCVKLESLGVRPRHFWFLNFLRQFWWSTTFGNHWS